MARGVGSLRTWATVKKIVLVGLLAVVFSETLPGVRATQLEVFLGVGIVVLVNAVFTLVQSRRARTFFSLGSAFVVRLLANIVLVLVAAAYDYCLASISSGTRANDGSSEETTIVSETSPVSSGTMNGSSTT